MKKLLLTALFASTFIFTTSEAAAIKNDAKKETISMEVNGKKLSLAEINSQTQFILQDLKEIDFATLPKQVQEEMLRKIASNVLLYEVAQKSGIEKNEDVKRKLKVMHEQVLISAFLEKKINETITEEALRQKYETVVARYKEHTEIKARHILVDNKEQAVAILTRLNKGESFEKIASEVSIDPGSKQNGGDLGYFTAEMMIPEFSQVAFAMNAGERSGPVKTVFGWHIIEVEDKRAKAAPTYEELLPKLRAALWQENADKFIKKLIQSADVSWQPAEGDEETLDFHLQ